MMSLFGSVLVAVSNNSVLLKSIYHCFRGGVKYHHIRFVIGNLILLDFNNQLGTNLVNTQMHKV